MQKNCIIYLATNKINKKRYVGQTIKTLKNRIKSHLQTSKTAKIGFDRALAKYGIENFEWEIVEKCLKKELNEKEKFYIKKFKTYALDHPDLGYNITIGGDNNFGSKGKFHFLNRMTKKDKEEWMQKYRCGKNNPNYGNGKNLCGKNHFSKRMTDQERRQWVGKISGDNNYQKKLSKKELKEKNFLNRMSEEDKQKWIDSNLRGDNNPFKKKSYLYRGVNNPRYGKTGLLSGIYKKYIITFPDGRIFLAICLVEFCKKFNKNNKLHLTGNRLSRCATGHSKAHKGFGCRYFCEKTDKKIKEYNGEQMGTH